MFNSCMKITIPFVLSCCLCGLSLMAQPMADTVFFSLGDSTVAIVRQADSPVVQGLYFLSLHENEQTGITVTTDHITAYGGIFTHLAHGGERNVTFSFNDTLYRFDPNRMFTAEGRRKTLDTLGAYNTFADSIVALFADSLLSSMPDPLLVMAVHNNSDENFSVNSYKKGGVYEHEAAAVYINKRLDADDFILTTDSHVFEFLKDKKCNAVLQDNAHCTDDGSLSVYYGKKGISYINIEAEHGHTETQAQLLSAVQKFIAESFSLLKSNPRP